VCCAVWTLCSFSRADSSALRTDLRAVAGVLDDALERVLRGVFGGVRATMLNRFRIGVLAGVSDPVASGTVRLVALNVKPDVDARARALFDRQHTLKHTYPQIGHTLHRVVA